ncbi:vWA domain-containing protein [Pontivivens insulae]|uniref:VWFA domain-containing protein n=1 Tax=Pontivivens insulae TaxID=1639689 RepID=A0A2R8A7Y1_9RHOB|nr:VWA domain-containing protein [Pontivivens insulae]RED18436.1 Ca-activated chloride channel family protein [Pontivivens insulae]SPF28334.1 hypothetical protein POI8812_00632 [Pontivivens insulae]
MMRRVFAPLFLTLATAAGAQDAVPARTIVVMDGSGSMWGQIDGRTKLEIARETVAEVVGGLPAERQIGLIAYGHRTRGDCSDIEIMVPPAAGTGSAILDAVNNMRFQGRTPLSEAVRRAAVELRFTEDPATVVLVTDGLETCNADPCALGTELEQAGLNFTAHVVGFGLTAEEGAQVSCLAENTGGSYFEASDGAALTDALDRTINASATVVVEQPASPPPPPQPLASLEAADSAVIVSPLVVTWDGPGGEDDYIDIAPADQPRGRWLSWAPLGEGDTVVLRMPPDPGEYVLRYVSTDAPDPIVASRPITVIEGEFVLDGPAFAEPGELMTVHWRGPGGDEDYLDVMDATSNATQNEPTWAWVSEGNPARFHAPVEPGEYNLRYVVQGESTRAVGLAVPLTILPSTAQIVAPAAVQPGSEFPVRAEGPINGNFWVDIVTPGFTDFSGEIDYFYLTETTPEVSESSLTAPSEPGQYELRYVIEDNRFNRRIIRRVPIEVSVSAPADAAIPPHAASAPATVSEPPAPAALQPIVPSAPADDGEQSILNEDVGLTCEGIDPCAVADAQTGLELTLPASWYSDFPVQTSDGVRASFFGPDGDPTVTLNVPNAPGQCRETAQGTLCGPDPRDPAFRLIQTSLGAPAKAPETDAADPTQALIEGILGGVAENGGGEGAAMLQEMLGGMNLQDLQDFATNGGAPAAAPAAESIPVPLNGRDPDALLEQILGQ